MGVQAISLAPDVAMLYMQRVNLLKEGRVDDAMADYATAMFLEPGIVGRR